MRYFKLYLLPFIIFTSCKNDPNKQIEEGKVKDNIYHSKEIGWTIEIPKGWDITQGNITQKREAEGLKAIKEATGINYNTRNLKQLISFQKDRFHVFNSSSEKFELEYDGEWEDSKDALKEILYKTFSDMGINVDTISSKEKINNLEFDVIHITLYGPDGKVILYQDYYSRYINGFDFGVNLNYINDKEKDEIMRVWKNSKFE